MIQRIQTVYLIAAALFVMLGLVFNYFQAGSNTQAEMFEEVTISAISIDYHQDAEVVHSENPAFLTALTLLGFLLIGSIVFLFRNRLLQVKLIRLSILLIAANLLLIFFYYADEAKAMLQAEPEFIHYSWGVYLSIAAMLLLFLAQKAIIRDEQLVRSADRLR